MYICMYGIPASKVSKHSPFIPHKPTTICIVTQTSTQEKRCVLQSSLFYYNHLACVFVWKLCCVEMSSKVQNSNCENPLSSPPNDPFHRSISGKFLKHIQQLTDNEHQIGPCYKSNLYEDSWKLFFTSLLFMIPAVMAFLFNLFFLSGTSFTVSVVAMNYWRNAKFGWRRWIDMTVAKAAFLIYLSHAVMFARSLKFGVITAVITSTMYYLYTNVSVLIAKQSKEWINYHAAFHGMVILAQILVILEMA